MRTSAFQCPGCEKIADRGSRAITAHGWSLKLSCPVVGHHQWRVNATCFNCGKVPEYRTHKDGDETVSTLECCNRTWAPAGTGPTEKNPFLDERAI